MKSAEEIYAEALLEEKKAMLEMGLSKDKAHEYAFYITLLRNFGYASIVNRDHCPDWIYEQYLTEIQAERKQEEKLKREAKREMTEKRHTDWLQKMGNKNED